MDVIHAVGAHTMAREVQNRKEDRGQVPRTPMFKQWAEERPERRQSGWPVRWEENKECKVKRPRQENIPERVHQC